MRALALFLSVLMEVHVVALPATSMQEESGRAMGNSTAEDRIATLRALLDKAREAQAAQRFADARASVAEAMRTLDLDSSLELDGAVLAIVHGLGEVAWRAQALPLAKDAWARVLDACERTLPEGHPGLLGAKSNLAIVLKGMGRLAEARLLLEEVLAAREQTFPDDHPDLLNTKQSLASTMRQMGDLTGARTYQEDVLEARKRTLPEDHPDLVSAQNNLATTMRQMGQLGDARALQEVVLEARTKVLPEGHPDLLKARENLAVTLQEMGDLAGARTLQESVLVGRERLFSEEHPSLLRAKSNLAMTRRQMGDLAGARELQEAVLQARASALPPDHPDLLAAQGNLALTLASMGDLERARTLQEAVLASRERALPENHPFLLESRSSLASTLWRLGYLEDARRIQEAVVASYERTLPEEHPGALLARNNLSASVLDLGDLARARVLQESVLATYERTLPEGHPYLLGVRGNLALTMRDMGDLLGARALQEAVLAAREQSLPDDHPDLLGARGNLAATMLMQGDLLGARRLQEAVLVAQESSLPEGHPDLLSSRLNLSLTMRHLGDLEGARNLQESVVAVLEQERVEGHPFLLMAKGNLASTLFALGDLPGARAMQESVLGAYERKYPGDHPELLRARVKVTLVLAGLGDREALTPAVRALQQGIEARLASGVTRSSREAEAIVRDETDRLSRLLSLSEFLDSPGLSRQAFETVELARHVASSTNVHPEQEGLGEELQRRHKEALAVRRRISTVSEDTEELARLVLERDEIESRVREALAASGALLDRIRADELASALPEGAAAVGYVRYRLWSIDPVDQDRWADVESLLAHVLREDGTLRRVELGTVDEVASLVRAWREAVGTPLQRGIRLNQGQEPGRNEADAARALADKVLGPVIAAAGDGVDTFLVCLDDVLHLVPLDALPMPGDETGRLVGEAIDLHLDVSFASHLLPPRPLSGQGPLVALGGTNFNAVHDEAADGDARQNASEHEESNPGADLVSVRSGPGGLLFPPLRQTHYEAENIGVLFEELHDEESVVLLKEHASKDSLRDHATRSRWLHVATHGYFLPESVRSTVDKDPAAQDLWSPMSTEELVAGLAPKTLCGLALAGANRGRDSLGRLPGILTAEELAGWDLSNCELAVLSACETYVGIRRAGQGIQSLQSALHLAGARSSITSLWKVDDEWTRKLMEEVYTRLWVHHEPKAEALWKAKMALRRQGARTRDWAGWVLVGDPD